MVHPVKEGETMTNKPKYGPYKVGAWLIKRDWQWAVYCPQRTAYEAHVLTFESFEDAVDFAESHILFSSIRAVEIAARYANGERGDNLFRPLL